MKQCKACKQEKPISEFYAHKSTKDRLISICKACHSEKSKKRRETPENKERSRLATERWRKNPKNKRSYLSSKYKARYGITLDEYENMLDSQDNKCFICEEEAGYNNKPLYVDHCHSTNKVRKLLCQHCNSGLGMFKDNPELLSKAAEYVKQWQN